MTNKTNKTNPRHLYWVALAIYTVIAAIFALVQGDGDYIKHMEFIMIFFISGTVFDNRCDILRIKERLEHKSDKINPEAIDADYKPVE